MMKKIIFLIMYVNFLSLTSFAEESLGSELTQQTSSKESPLETAASITDYFIKFLDNRNVNTYIALNERIASNNYYFRDTCSFRDVRKLLDNKDYDKAINFLNGPDCLAYISTPSSHLYLAAANRAKGDIQSAKSHSSIAALLADIIEKTGDGSRSKPFHVLTVAAEYDYIDIKLDESRKSQASLRTGGKSFDVITLSSGKKIYFDITLHMQMLSRERLAKKHSTLKGFKK